MGGAVWPACVRHCKVDCNTTLGRCVVLALLLLPYISCITAEGIKYGGVPYSILPSEGPEEDASMQQWLPCWAEQGQGSPRHEALLAMLNGRKLAFVGDSLTRYKSLMPCCSLVLDVVWLDARALFFRRHRSGRDDHYLPTDATILFQRLWSAFSHV